MTIALPAILDTAAAPDLRQTLRTAIAAGRPLELDAAMVDRAGLACLQVLAAARAKAVAAGLRFAIDSPAVPLCDMAALAGLAAVLDPA